ncbi:hypothetical protein PRUPE_3G219900 [Prunus persica]|uniref:Uncharacterized protein n=1 Tax=Prunus persica TaxID=3760 RepID=A0A251Q531_PRUPE|nr:hypothetical protein PRUPE_3G219900 [Prunus persica]
MPEARIKCKRTNKKLKTQKAKLIPRPRKLTNPNQNSTKPPPLPETTSLGQAATQIPYNPTYYKDTYKKKEASHKIITFQIKPDKAPEQTQKPNKH